MGLHDLQLDLEIVGDVKDDVQREPIRRRAEVFGERRGCESSPDEERLPARPAPFSFAIQEEHQLAGCPGARRHDPRVKRRQEPHHGPESWGRGGVAEQPPEVAPFRTGRAREVCHRQTARGDTSPNLVQPLPRRHASIDPTRLGRAKERRADAARRRA
jgi:hypothetical protein